MDRRLFLIDGHALIFKMYYAFLRSPMINSKGADTSILYGFTKYILELIDRERPTHMAVAFDPPGGSFRNKMYPEYKANRSATPQLVIDALEPLTELCHALNIATLMEMGYEADDVIGTVARKFASRDLKVYMVTPDKDYGQLVDENIYQLKPGKAGGENIVLDSAGVCEKYGISEPWQVIELLAICGDVSDNVPGVKGVGEKGASKLIGLYGSVKGIYEHLDELPERQRVMFEEAGPHIELSHELVTINTAVPVDVSLDSMALDMEFSPEIAGLFEKYEFNSLKRYISHVAVAARPKKGNRIAVEEVPVQVICEAACRRGRVAIVTEADGEGIFAGIRYMVAVTETDGDCVYARGSADDFRVLLEDASVMKCGYGLKQQLNLLAAAGIELNGRLGDVELMHYLVNPEAGHKVEILAKKYLDVNLENALPREAETGLFDEAMEVVDYAWKAMEAAAVLLMYDRLRAEMVALSVTVLYDEMEEALIRVLAGMERNGVRVDLSQIRSFAGDLQKEMLQREAGIRKMAGEPNLNVSSPKQIGELLFEKLRLSSKPKKNKNGSYTTDEAVLSSLADRHPIVPEILEFRAVKKLLSTYIEPFASYVSPLTGKVHTTFNQALTSTGRLSSSSPNLQNIPIRSGRGKEIRKAFVPAAPDGLIVSADYSQIELRIMAHMCGDEHMVDAFKDGVDVHAVTASRIFAVPYAEVSSEQRRVAKTANFGIMYGISAFGLAQNLKTSRTEAKQIIDDYFAAFPSIRTFIDRTLEAARQKGYVETIFGRRRYIPDINSKNATVRALAERNAVNAPIQGTAADIIKMAMISVDRRMKAESLRSRMVLQVHDELLFDALPSEVETLCRLVVGEMEGVISLRVPLTVECNYGKNWLEAH